MGTGDSLDLGRAFPPSRGGKISFRSGATARNALPRGTFGNSSHGEYAKTSQIGKDQAGVVRMSQFFDRYPGAKPWVFAASQAVAMLGFHVMLRVAVL
jgi:hypothetical protein